MPLIEKFKINNLHNYYDVELNFKNDKTIYIGENGIGKTTILSMLYYLLDLNYERLSKYIFESLEIEFEGKKSVKITKSDIKNISVTIAKAIKDKEDFNAEINGKAKKKERVKLRKISINSKSNIESEDEAKEYILAIEKDIEKLKNEMLEAIKNNKIVDIG